VSSCERGGKSVALGSVLLIGECLRSQAMHIGQAANWVWMGTMIAAFRPKHGGMARVASREIDVV
jgi:hypothetical protein